VAALTLLGDGGSTGWIWDYRCDCGMDYRVKSVADGARFWPATSHSRFSQRSFEAGKQCVRCGQTLSIEGCAIHDARSRSGDRATI
jgi:hypothetical protein